MLLIFTSFIKLFSSFTTASRLSTMSVVQISLIMLIMLFIKDIQMLVLQLGYEYYIYVVTFFNGEIAHIIDFFLIWLNDLKKKPN